jgi:small-conductance mechanosensitive channel
MVVLPGIEDITKWLATFEAWVMQYVLTMATLQQLLAVFAIMLVARLAARKLAAWLAVKGKAWRERYFSLISSRFYISLQDFLQLLLISLILWAAFVVAAAAKWPLIILNVAASLMSAWAIIRIGSSVIQSRFWSKTLAISMWAIAALNIVGWLDIVATTLDKAVLPIGQHSLSLLVLMKGGVILAVLLWLAGIASDGMERALWRSQLTPSQKVLFHKLAKILFIALAILFGLNTVGIDFTALAVFSGALGIGIGFGLQKVFANLMSGFILLMDKSIKPGDVIAVADTYGWVNRLGARYVSILTRDGKEHLIPNETMITERVENWSYTDGKVRIHIPIGVSYNSDIPLVRKLLLQVAQNHPRILKKPEPVSLIAGFGDHSVNFEIRAWIEDPVNGIGNVRSGVYEDVWKIFKEHGIEIPFPQRDLNLNMEQVKEIIGLLKNNAG